MLPKSNSAFNLLKEQDPDKWENFKAWNILKSTPKFLEPRGDASETTEDEDKEEDATSPPNKVNVEDQPSTMDASADDPPEEKEEHETRTNLLSTSSYKPSNDSSTTTSLVNVVSHASRPKKQHLGRDAAKVKLQLDKERKIVEFWGLPPLIPLLQCANRLGFEICSVNSCQSEQGSLVTVI